MTDKIIVKENMDFDLGVQGSVILRPIVRSQILKDLRS